MSRTQRILLLTILGALVMGMAMTLATAIIVYRAGSVAVSVREKAGDRTSISLRIPAILLRAGLMVVPERQWREIRLQAGPEAARWWPVAEAAFAGLRNSPDGTILQVDSPDEKIRIVKRDDALVIDVDSTDETVHVAVPLSAVSDVVHRLRPVEATSGQIAASSRPRARG